MVIPPSDAKVLIPVTDNAEPTWTSPLKVESPVILRFLPTTSSYVMSPVTSNLPVTRTSPLTYNAVVPVDVAS